MNGLAFFDTNVPVYAEDASSPDKQDGRSGFSPSISDAERQFCR
jgi:hypothetical protein